MRSFGCKELWMKTEVQNYLQRLDDKENLDVLAIAGDTKEGTLSCFVGNAMLVTGEANFKELMRVDGHLSGRVVSSSGTLIVGASGKVDANVDVAVAIIHGTINGDVIATQRLELGRDAKVNGNIQTASLVIEEGAVLEGSCNMLQMGAAREKAVGTAASKAADRTD
jgi:cytoskeletal protein CcmA (bactofilin family)